MTRKAEQVLKVGAQLGEGPLWSPGEQMLYWLDIVRPAIHRWQPGASKFDTTEMAQWVCALAHCEDGGMIGAVEDGIAFIDPKSGDFEIIVNPLSDRAMRFNDGSCDRRGRYWSGTMLREDYKPVCSFYKLNCDRTLEVMDTGLSLSNGIGFSPDDAIMYLSDSIQRTVFAYDFDIEKGTIRNKRPHIIVEEKDGYPDGLTVDAEGFIWLCHWDGWKVTRHAPDGRLVDTIETPVPRPTSCAFGGADFSTLYITSAIMDLTAEQLSEAPQSGDLFAIRLDVPGVAEPVFRSAP